jgi:hypothetical protein
MSEPEITKTPEQKKPVPPQGKYKPVEVVAMGEGTQLAGPAVPVKLVFFNRNIQFPGCSAESRAKTEKRGALEWKVFYLPAMRHFRIEYTDPRPDKCGVGYVHEVVALSWEPL